MNKNAIQKYAIWARNELIEQVKQRAYQYGISDKGYGDENAAVFAGRVLSADEKRQRTAFVHEIQKHGYQEAVEEVAYTWFNRFLALRFMEINDYLPTHVRVFSDASGGFNPEILKDVLHLDLDSLDNTKVSELLNANQTEELYRYLLLTQCNALNAALPEMFEKLGSYTEMLLPNNILKQDSVLARLVKDIDEDDWKDAVQIIGWMYQYYNTEPKQAVFDGLKKNIKITKEKIPAATQLFTPDWIVRYMVENSLGRLWLESHPNPKLKTNWKYYLDEAEQTPEVAEKLRVLRSQSPVKSPEDIRLIDPCMGSGHILVYAFDVLMQIYESVGASPRDAAKLILEKNIYGLDIDRRAYQLAYFSLMMKARQYNRGIFTGGLKPQVYHPAGFPDGEEYGSLVKVDELPPKPVEKSGQLSLEDTAYDIQLNAWNFKRLLAQKYDVVVTNPPYMGSSGMGAMMSDFIKSNYSDTKSDTFSAFIEQCSYLTLPNRYYSMIIMQAWMKLGVFEKIRNTICSERQIICLSELADMVLGIAYESSAFVIRKTRCEDSYIGTYSRVETEIRDNESAIQNAIRQSVVLADQQSFFYIKGTPIAYMLSKSAARAYSKADLLEEMMTTREGMTTGNNDLFLRFWFEIVTDTIGQKWYPYNKGGEFRKWYGNDDYVVNWENDGHTVKSFKDEKTERVRSHNYNGEFSFCEGITWSAFSSRGASFRYSDSRFLFDSKGSKGFCKKQYKNTVFYVLALLNSCVGERYLTFVAGAKDKKPGHISSVPIIVSKEYIEKITKLTKEVVVECSRSDWDSFETSWAFRCHPLICGEQTVAAAVAKLEREAVERFDTLKANEEELNRIFIDIYGLQDELTPEVANKDVTVRKTDLQRDIKSLISYAVGCIFGRYSLDSEGIAYAGGDWDNSKYISFIPDKDNILPICDDEYFDDDIMGRLINFVREVYGTDTLEENLKFIADALGKSGTSREVIRNYLLNDFYADHCKIYQKRPIYWLLDSGKKNGFKALIYLHRYSRDLLAKLRTDYVHEQQERYRTQLSHIITALNTATGAERARLLKQQDKLSEQLKEITAFEEKVHHLADQNIEIDLNDGVKKNYEIFTDVLAKI